MVASYDAWYKAFGEPWRSRSVRRIARNKNRGDFCDTVVKTFGSLYKEFLSCKTSIPVENRVGKAHEGPTSHQGAPGGVARPSASCAPCGSPQLFLIFVFFLIFQNWQKVFLWNFWSRFTYRITYLFLFRVLECSGRSLLCIPPVS
jgi:hypothetical protein